MVGRHQRSKVPSNKSRQLDVAAVKDVHEHISRETSKIVNDLQLQHRSNIQWLTSVTLAVKRKINSSRNYKPSPKRHKTPGNIDSDHVESNRCEETNNCYLVELDVSTMKVAELRQELRARDLDAKGLKKDLQKRLQQALQDEKKNAVGQNNDLSLDDISNNHQVEEIDIATAQKSSAADLSPVAESPNLEVNDEIIESGNVADMEVDDEQAQDNDPLNAQHMVLSCKKETTQAVAMPPEQEVSKPMDTSPSLVSNSISSHENIIPDSTTKKIELSIDNLTKLSVDSLTEECNDETNDHEMEDSTSNNSVVIPSPSKKGTVRKIMNATTKLFSPKKVKSPCKQPRSPLRQQLQEQKAALKPTKHCDRKFFGASSDNAIDSDALMGKDKGLSVVETVHKFNHLQSSRPTDALTNSDSTKHSQSKNVLGEKNSSPPVAENAVPSIMSKNHHEMKMGFTQQIPNKISTDVNKISSDGSRSISGDSSSSSSSSKKLQQKRDQMAAARKARLEEMRGKSKLAKAKTFATSSFNQSLAATTKSSHTNTNYGKGITSQTELMKSSVPAQRTHAQIKEDMRKKAEAQKKASTISSSLPKSAKKIPGSIRKTPQTKGQLQARKVLSPMDTYEISDKEDSDSDMESESEDDKPKKRVPNWARSVNLGPALHKQYTAPDRLDPDVLFHEITTCNLDEIFQKKARYKKRTSTGNWTKDKLTVAEKLVYKRDMGYPVDKRTS